MSLRRIIDFDCGVVVMDEDEYRRTVLRSLRDLIRVAEANGLADDPVVTRSKVKTEDLLTRQRALCDLIHLAKDNGLNDNININQAKELIRCRVLRCGLVGACDGVGAGQYPCPLKDVQRKGPRKTTFGIVGGLAVPLPGEGPVTNLSRARNGFRVGGRNPIAIVGQTYGLITVLDRVEPDIRGNGIPARYECRCNRCNATFVAKGSDVVHRRARLCCQPPRRRV